MSSDLFNKLIDSGVALLNNGYLWSAVSAYLICQLIKTAIDYHRGQRHLWRSFTSSGSMPSSHTGSVIALTTMIGLNNGFDSSLFAIAILGSVIVAYDACHVRRAVGEQGLVVNQLINQYKNKKDLLSDLQQDLTVRQSLCRLTNNKLDKSDLATGPYYSRGHLVNEVLIGGLIGFLVGLIGVVL